MIVLSDFSKFLPISVTSYLHLLLTGLIASVIASFRSEHLFLNICHFDKTLYPKIFLDSLETVSLEALFILSMSTTQLIPPNTLPIPYPI